MIADLPNLRGDRFEEGAVVGDEKQNGAPVTFNPPTGRTGDPVRIVSGDDE